MQCVSGKTVGFLVGRGDPAREARGAILIESGGARYLVGAVTPPETCRVLVLWGVSPSGVLKDRG